MGRTSTGCKLQPWLLSCAVTVVIPQLVHAQPPAHGAQTHGGPAHGAQSHGAAKTNAVPPKTSPAATKVPPVQNVSQQPLAPDPDAEAMKLFKPVEQQATAWLKRPELFHSVVGLEIMDVPSGRVLFSHNGQKRFVTASIAKVLTTACAYDTLGGNFRYRTSLVGYGEIRNARLSGSLYVQASQDPTFDRTDLHELLQGLQSRGIKYINGKFDLAPVTGGGDHFSTEWLVQDYGQDWMPVSSDLVMNENILAGDAGGGYPLNIATAAGESNALTRSLLQAPWGSTWATFNKLNSTVTLYKPDIPVNGGVCVGNPNDYNMAMARMSLKNMGIKLDGHDLPPEGGGIPLGEHASKPLSEILRYCLKKSDNLYAQQLLRTLGALAPLDKRLERASLEDRGLARLHSWLAGSGVPGDEVVMWDGCGLSRKNAITPHAFNLVLRHMAGPSGNGPYIDLLLHAGEGNARTWRYKTGAMDSVRSISGIVRTSTGQPLALTVIVNDHKPQVGELRTSIGDLVSRMQNLGGLKLTPVPPAQKHAGTAGARGTTASNSHHRRRRH